MLGELGDGRQTQKNDLKLKITTGEGNIFHRRKTASLLLDRQSDPGRKMSKVGRSFIRI
jgi:hypothetical protein